MLTRPLTRPLVGAPSRGLTQAGSGGGAAFDPASLFGAGDVGFAYDFSTPSALFQDSARTTPVTALADPIGSATDLSGKGNHGSQATGVNRPLYQGYADFDGSNDFVASPSIGFNAVTDKATIIIGVRKDVAGSSRILELNAAPIGLFIASDVGTDNYHFNFGGGTLRATTYAAPVQNVISCAYDVQPATIGDEVKPRIDGVIPTLAVFVAGPAGAFPNKITSGVITIGAQTGGTLPFNGRVYRVIVIGRLLTTDETLAAEAWCAEPFV